uniref:Uncharacterized protein n=1 Tax=Nelumbo nucifera TaxID=4432 RepID=A0A822ZQZ7_NELNU|nr:TPA_asm: hypothetical protein HUJ06_003999 [Nelumbo nucifera]
MLPGYGNLYSAIIVTTTDIMAAFCATQMNM